jgi:hypothetical protein
VIDSPSLLERKRTYVAASAWPLLIVLAVLWIVIVILLIQIISRNEATFSYALDDAYIHLAMAKHLVQNAVWGISPYEFSASTSSPGWTLLLAGLFAISGQAEIWPLILNLVLATLLLVIADRVLQRSIHSALFRGLALLFILFITPLPTLVFSGMEHVLHLVLSAALFGRLYWYEFVVAPNRRLRVSFQLWLIVAVAMAVRYETVFLVGPLIMYYIWRRDWVLALGMAVAVIIGPIIVGIIQVAHGWYFLPNSLLAKGISAGLSGNVVQSLLSHFILMILRSAALFMMMLLVVAWLLVRPPYGSRRRDPRVGWGAAFIVAGFLQYGVAQVGWLYRYEAYLLIFGSLMILAGNYGRDVLTWLHDDQGRWKQVAVIFMSGLAVVTTIVFGYRAYHALGDITTATEQIYNEYFQMARFLRLYYPAETVVINDLGAIGFYTAVRPVDLFALGNRESLAAQLTGTFDTAFIDRWTHEEGARLALIHDQYYTGTTQLPAQWVLVGRWTEPNSFFGLDSSISFYAVDPRLAPTLRSQFGEFTPLLPPAMKAAQYASGP